MKKIIGLTRYAVFVPAVAAIIGALLLMVQGSIEIVKVAIDTIRPISRGKMRPGSVGG